MSASEKQPCPMCSQLSEPDEPECVLPTSMEAYYQLYNEGGNLRKPSGQYYCEWCDRSFRPARGGANDLRRAARMNTQRLSHDDREELSATVTPYERMYLFELLHGASLASDLWDKVGDSGRYTNIDGTQPVFKRFPELETAFNEAAEAMAAFYQMVGEYMPTQGMAGHDA